MLKFDDKFPNIARPYTACFVILKKDNKIAMVLRKNTSWYDGYYGLPAGKGEWHEPFTIGAMREAKEEAGVDVDQSDLRFVHLVHRHTENDQSFMDVVDVYFEANKWVGEPNNAEEHKSERLDWLDIDNLPENVVPPQKDALERIAKGQFYSEYGWVN